MDLLCISKVSLLFCVFLIRLKRVYTRVLLTGQGRLRWLRRGVYVAAEVALTRLRSDLNDGIHVGRWISNGGLGLIREFGPSETLGLTLAVGLKIYDSESSFGSDRVNRSAVPGRPIGD